MRLAQAREHYYTSSNHMSSQYSNTVLLVGCFERALSMKMAVQLTLYGRDWKEFESVYNKCIKAALGVKSRSADLAVLNIAGQ